MMIQLYKRSAIGIYEYSLNLVKTLEGLKLTMSYGAITGKKTTRTISITDAKYKSLVTAKKREGFKTLDDLQIQDPNKVFCDLYAELDIALPVYNIDPNNLNNFMLCKPFVSNKFEYPADAQPKINGCRSTITWVGSVTKDLFNKKSPICISHEGTVYEIKHIQDAFEKIYIEENVPKDVVFDGEMYHRGSKAPTISGAARNSKNPIHSELQFHCFDLAIPDVVQSDRLLLKNKYLTAKHVYVQIHPSEHMSDEIVRYNIVNVCHSEVNSDLEAYEYRDKCLEYEYEGCVIRNRHVPYRFGSRPMSIMKLKKPLYDYFVIVDIMAYGYDNDDNDIGKGVIFILRNDKNNTLFEANANGKVSERYQIFKDKNKHIGNMIQIKYFERTKNKLPFHATALINSLK